jgi:hypothetical protein
VGPAHLSSWSWLENEFRAAGTVPGRVAIVAASSVTASCPQPHFSTLATDRPQLCRAAARTETMLSTLPVEILLDIIQGLPPKTIASLPALSKSWATFMATNESSIYHFTSKRHGYADSDAAAPPEGWKAWCKCPWEISCWRPVDNPPSVIRKFQIELRWIGKLPGNPSRVKVPSGTTGSFHRIKVDEEAGYVINTFTDGGLVVSDIHDRRMLWSLDEVLCVLDPPRAV